MKSPRCPRHSASHFGLPRNKERLCVLCYRTIGRGERKGIFRVRSRGIRRRSIDTDDVSCGEGYAGEECGDECEAHGEEVDRLRLCVLQGTLLLYILCFGAEHEMKRVR